MKQVFMALLALVMLLVVSQALAMEAPTVTTPEEGAALGPNYDVIGSMPYRAFLVVVTDVVVCETEEVLRTVPGIRHWTADDGAFHFRVASPRVSFGEKDTAVKYRVRVYEASADGTGPETVINATCLPPDQAMLGIVLTGQGDADPVAPTVTSPQEGAALGPNYDIIGSMPYRAFLVLVTDVMRTDTGEALRTVPGIRHWTNQDGTFQFRAASPRIFIGEHDLPLAYRIRIYQATPEETGPETVINATMAQ